MKLIDRILQRWRISKALKYVPAGSRVLDIGCHKGEFFMYAGNRLSSGIGIDPLLTDSKAAYEPCQFPFSNKIPCPDVTLIKGFFPDDIPPMTKKFDTIIILAVLEHIPENMLTNFVSACYNWINDNGRVILTVPSPFVDNIITVLSKLRLIDGMSLEEHYGLSIKKVPDFFLKGNYFMLIKHSRFQLGLNNLFVFNKNHP